jgi:hypothetical protein
MSGKAAAFGGRMMGSVADQLMQQFAANFAAQVAARSPQRDATAHDAGSVGVPAGQSSPAPPPVANELDGLALAWAVFKDWLRSLFGRKPV